MLGAGPGRAPQPAADAMDVLRDLPSLLQPRPGIPSRLSPSPEATLSPEGRVWQAQAVRMLVSCLPLSPSLSVMAVFTQKGASCASSLALPFLASFQGDPFLSVWTAALFPQLHSAPRRSPLELPNPMMNPFIAAICTRVGVSTGRGQARMAGPKHMHFSSEAPVLRQCALRPRESCGCQ